MARLCHEGAAHRCFGPWYLCALFGCAVGNPRPCVNPTPRQAAEETRHKAEVEERRRANIAYLQGERNE